MYVAVIAYMYMNYKEHTDCALISKCCIIQHVPGTSILEAFKNFPILRELELSLNGMRGIKVGLGEFPLLEVRFS